MTATDTPAAPALPRKRPGAFVVVLLLLLSESTGPWLMVLAAVAAGVVGRLIGPYLGKPHFGLLGNALLAVLIAAVPVILYFYVVTAVGFDDWGGFMLNLFLAFCAIILCYPLGILLALGGMVLQARDLTPDDTVISPDQFRNPGIGGGGGGSSGAAGSAGSSGITTEAGCSAGVTAGGSATARRVAVGCGSGYRCCSYCG